MSIIIPANNEFLNLLAYVKYLLNVATLKSYLKNPIKNI